MRAIIITAHSAEDFTSYFKLESGDFIIAADGGCDAAASCGVVPHIVAGDMDSVVTLSGSAELIKLPVDKDDTDTHHCAKLAVERGFKEIVIIGGIGGRLDHTLANLHTMAFLAENGVCACLRDKRHEIFMLKNCGMDINGREGCALALFAYGGNARGVTESGVKFPLDNALLTPMFPLGASNRISAARARVSVDDGFLIVMLDYFA